MSDLSSMGFEPTEMTADCEWHKGGACTCESTPQSDEAEYDVGMYNEMRAAVEEHGGMPDLLPDNEFDCCIKLCARIANNYMKQELANQAMRLQVTIDSMYDELEAYRDRGRTEEMTDPWRQDEIDSFNRD